MAAPKPRRLDDRWAGAAGPVKIGAADLLSDLDLSDDELRRLLGAGEYVGGGSGGHLRSMHERLVKQALGI